MKKFFKYKIDGQDRNLTIIKKKKKHISLQVKPTLEIILNIPFRVTYDMGLKIIGEKEKWIKDKLEKYSNLEKTKDIYFLGKLYSIKSIDKMILKDSNLLGKPLNLNEWYHYKLSQLLEESIEKYSSLMGLYSNKIKIRCLKSAWGICYSSKNITFNLNLIKLPIEFIDYLVIHELGHLKHPNHSKEYREYIGKYIENPKEYRKWLRKNGYKFM